jgi:hypothetical protein
MKLDRALLKKILYIMIILAIAPFALEVPLIADVAGADFAVLFAIYYLKSTSYILLERWLEFKRSVTAVCTLLAELYFFRPRVVVTHLAVSSLLLSCLMWLAPLYLSSGLLN